MLIRICDHFRNNPKRIDKLIAIKGLPREWMFYEGPEGTELRKPWQPDIDVNIPYDVRSVCEPMYVTIRYPSVDANKPGVVEKRKILGVKIDYNTEPGREMWEQVERYVEESMPRNERIPVPVVCSKDERSAFETYTPRRSPTGSLEMVSSAIPEVDLTRFVPGKVEILPAVEVVLAQQAVAPAPQVPVKAGSFVCEVCSVPFEKAQGLRMHKMKKHPKKEKVGVP